MPHAGHRHQQVGSLRQTPPGTSQGLVSFPRQLQPGTLASLAPATERYFKKAQLPQTHQAGHSGDRGLGWVTVQCPMHAQHV